MNLSYPEPVAGDVVIGCNLYVNGAFKAMIPPQEEGEAVPKLFYASVSIPEPLESMHLTPLFEKGGEETDPDEYIVFQLN